MRVSTSQIYSTGISGINRQLAETLKLQQQIGAEKRIITPSDDPVAAAQVLQVQQAKDVNSQYSTNIDNAKSALGLEDSQLTSVNDMFAKLKELAVEAGSGSLSAADRSSIALELRARFDELVGIANAKDGVGNYLFAGYQGRTQPFSGTVEGGVTYAGDDGQRALQVSASRLLETSDSGSTVFERISNGNGTFNTTYGTNNVSSGPNSGTGTISGGTVSDPAAWVAPTSGSYTLRFSVSGGVTTYQIYDGATALLATPGTYTSGQAIPLQQTTPTTVDFGASVTVAGTPANGDSFAISPSTSQSLFSTLSNLIQAMEASNTNSADAARYQMDVSSALNNLDRANDSVLQVRSAVGSRLNEITALQDINSSVGVQYDDQISTLQDLDLVKTYTDLTQKQTNLQAALKSFTAVSQLSLFNYL
jgi:flagellar hook-associated protein 3 FlgL